MEGSHFFTPLPGCLHTRRSILHSPHAAYTSDHPPKKWSEATVIRTWCYCPKPSCQSCLTQHICLVCLVRKLIYIKKQHKVLQKEHGSVNVKTKVPLMMSTSCEECQEGTANEEVWWGRGQHWPEGSPCWRLPPNGAKGAPPGARRNRKDTHWQGCGGIFCLISIVYLFISRSLHYLQYMSIEILQFLWCKQ